MVIAQDGVRGSLCGVPSQMMLFMQVKDPVLHNIAWPCLILTGQKWKMNQAVLLF